MVALPETVPAALWLQQHVCLWVALLPDPGPALGHFNLNVALSPLLVP